MRLVHILDNCSLKWQFLNRILSHFPSQNVFFMVDYINFWMVIHWMIPNFEKPHRMTSTFFKEILQNYTQTQIQTILTWCHPLEVGTDGSLTYSSECPHPDPYKFLWMVPSSQAIIHIRNQCPYLNSKNHANYSYSHDSQDTMIQVLDLTPMFKKKINKDIKNEIK